MNHTTFAISQLSIERLREAIANRPISAAPFSGAAEKLTPRQRKAKAAKDYWSFDKLYFPKEIYSEGYSAPNQMLKDMIAMAQSPGIHIVFGPRRHGKTVTGKKLLIWLLLSGRVSIAGVYAEILNPKSYNLLKDVAALITLNDRIMSDYQPEFFELNNDQFAFRIPGEKEPRFCAAFSEGRSVRGYTKLFGRPQFILGDDVETLESSMAAGAVQMRIDKLGESLQSMTENGTFIISANDFSSQSALHLLRQQQEEGLLAKHWRVHVYQAWNKKALWHSRWPVKSEAALKARLKPRDESDWQANFQSNPIPPEGIMFTRENYREYTGLPADARGIIYTDPNLSKKGLGDTTAIVALLWSPSTALYYIGGAIVRSFRKSERLLQEVINLKAGLASSVIAIAFDGNVTQESTWTDMIRSYSRINGLPFPVVEYKRYRVNDLAKNTQLLYDAGQILFPAGFAKTPDGSRFLAQLFSFSGKKSSGIDDAPDALICAFEYIHERHIPKKSRQQPLKIKDFYTL